MERVTPDSVFDWVGVDYAGPVYVKYGHTRKSTVIKYYICLFVSLSAKTVHLALMALQHFWDSLLSEALIWSDHGSNFVGAARELKELAEFLGQQKVQGLISNFCICPNIQWKFIPDHLLHFGGLWEAAVKSSKNHLKRVIGGVKLTSKEFTTVLVQIEACLKFM